MYNNDFFQNSNDSTVTGNNNYVSNDMDVNVSMNNNSNSNMGNNFMPSSGNVQEKVVHRTFVHEVPHTCPIHTRIINHHVYKHTYRPVYTCSEENVCSNVQCGSCCQFR